MRYWKARIIHIFGRHTWVRGLRDRQTIWCLICARSLHWKQEDIDRLLDE